MTHPNARGEAITKEARLRQVASLLLSGVTDQNAIAETLGVRQPTVSRYIKQIEAQWREEAMADITEAKGRDLLRIDRMIMAAWKQANKGDTRSIGEVRNLIKLRADILGYAEAPKLELTAAESFVSALREFGRGNGDA